MTKGHLRAGVLGALLVGLLPATASAGGKELQNGCKNTDVVPCFRIGNCEPLDGQVGVTVFLSDVTTATIPRIDGSLTCGGELPGSPEICGDGDGKIDEKPECR